MAADESKSAAKAKKETTAEVMFKCQLCGKDRPVSEMKLITRFRPVVVVCRECEKTLR